MSNHLEFENWVASPLERVFAFFSDPENLPRIMPATTGIRLVRIDRIAPPPAPMDSAPAADRTVGVGSVIVTSFRVLPFLHIRAQWTSRITEFEWNRYFVDVKENVPGEGPFRRWHHRHQFERQTRKGTDGTPVDGTLVSDFVDYEVGFGLPGRILDRLFIAGQLSRTFAHRQRTLPKLLS